MRRARGAKYRHGGLHFGSSCQAAGTGDGNWKSEARVSSVVCCWPSRFPLSCLLSVPIGLISDILSKIINSTGHWSCLGRDTPIGDPQQEESGRMIAHCEQKPVAARSDAADSITGAQTGNHDQRITRLSHPVDQLRQHLSQASGRTSSLSFLFIVRSLMLLLLWQAQSRAENAESVSRDLQSQYNALMMTHKEILLRQDEFEGRQQQQQTSLGETMERLLAHALVKLLNGARRLVASQQQLKALYQMHKISTHSCLASVVEHLKTGDIALTGLVDLSTGLQHPPL